MKVITGNMLDIQAGVLIHQVNNKRVMGAGIAKSIRAMYPQHYVDYMNAPMTLGNLVKTRIHSKLGIIGMVAQNGYGRNANVRYTDYEAFRNCLIAIKEIYDLNPAVRFYMPVGIGCGLANGEWNKVFCMIQEICPFITLVKFNS